MKLFTKIALVLYILAVAVRADALSQRQSMRGSLPSSFHPRPLRVIKPSPLENSPEEQSRLRAQHDAEVLVRVNGEPIYRWQLRQACNTRQKELLRSGSRIDFHNLGKFQRKVLTELIYAVLLTQEAERRGIKVSAQEVRAAWNNLQRLSGKSKEEFTEQLKNSGISEEAYYEYLRKSLLLQKLAAQVGQQIKVDEEFIQAYYANAVVNTPELFTEPEMVALRDIYLRAPKLEQFTDIPDEINYDVIEHQRYAPEVARTMNAVVRKALAQRLKTKDIENLIERNAYAIYNLITKENRPFAEVAKKYSEDPVTRDKGGDLGYVPIESLQADIASRASALPIGLVSRPFRTPDGFHIIQVYDRRPKRIKTYEEVKEQLHNIIYLQELDDRLHALAEQLREKAKLEFIEEI